MTTKRVDPPVAGFSDDDSAPPSNLSSMQRAIVTIQKLRSKVEFLERARTEPIAIIGMACRFPGGANSPEAFFRILEDGVDAVTEVPPTRWELDGEQPTDPELRAVRWGAFLQDIDQFDAQFFNISPREASKMDPQQRLLLEITFEALERGGQVQEKLVGSRTGVFLGIMNNDYAELSAMAGPDQEDTYTTTGNGHCFPAGRVSYTFGFQGPSVAIDTACSSSLVAVHLACQSLRNGECNMAVAGGVNLMLVPSTSRKFAKTQALSPDGRCKSFDATGNGFVRGEGCGMIVLKRLADAERDGDPIVAIIRGSAINQDGRSTGLTAPNVLAQQAMLTQALVSARVAASDIGYIETHGTGTPLGDPIEMEALKEVLGSPRSNGLNCVLGAVKTNIGHLEAAAGIAGIIKTALILQRGVIPRNLHFRTLNPRIRIESTPFTFPEENLPWRLVMKRRIAGVSSFGMSGTNAHAILEEWPPSTEEDLAPEDTICLLPLSAKTPEALRALANAYREYMLQLPPEVKLKDIVHSASIRRSHYEHRLAIVGNSRQEVIDLLQRYLSGDKPSGVMYGRSTPARAKVVFVFSGQGSQWLGMARELYQTDPSFRSVIDTCDNLLMPRLGWSILDELDATDTVSRVAETQVAQPLLFAIQIALVEMLRSWGIAPDAMIGHSVGEIAAAHIAGILSLDEAVRLVAIRGRIMQKATGMGKMVSVVISPHDAQNMIAGYEDRVAIAAINDPNSVVLSGQSSAINDIIARCEERGIMHRPLHVDYAFHSPQMASFERELVDRLGRIDTRRATLAMYSTVLAECVDGKELDVRYWGRNIRETVDFAGAMYAAIRDGYQLFLEIGPHPVLTANVQQCLAAKNTTGLAVYTMRRREGQMRTLLQAVSALYAQGCAPEWSRIVPTGGKCVPLPTYPWQKSRHWLSTRTNTTLAVNHGPDLGGDYVHPLLGMQLDSAERLDACFWQRVMLRDSPDFVRDHVVDDVPTFPASGYVVMALEAAKAMQRPLPVTIKEVAFEQLLSFHEDERVTVQSNWNLGTDGHASFHIASRRGSGAWTKHVSAKLVFGDATSGWSETIAAMRARCTKLVSSDEHLQHMNAWGLSYGPGFRIVNNLRFGTAEVLGQLSCSREVIERDAFTYSVVLLDGALQALAALANQSSNGPRNVTILPVGIGRLRVEASLPTAISILGRIRSDDGTTIVGDMILVAKDESVVASAEGVLLRRVQREKVELAPWLEKCAFQLHWHKQDRPSETAKRKAPAGAWLVLGHDAEICPAFVRQLREKGEWVVFVNLADAWEKHDANTYSIRASNSNDYVALIEDAFGMQTACRDIVHLGALSGGPFADTADETIIADQSRGSLSVLYTVQALARRVTRAVPRLWLVTRGAQSVDDDDRMISVPQAAIWGLARTIALEHPEIDCFRIDLDPEEHPDVVTRHLVGEVFAPDQEDQIALRKRGRFVARLVRSTLRQTPAARLSIVANGAYLITGGLGGLGLSTAQWLVNQGARRLALVGRHEPNEMARAAIAAMVEGGARVEVIAADVTRSADVDGVMARVQDTLGPLRGIVHAAGILADRTTLELSAEDMERVFAPKVLGAFYLHRAARHDTLDFFVVFSSIAGLFGSSGQANYAAANASLDAFARARRAIGKPTISFQWGPFSDVGMAAAHENRGTRLAHRGLESLSPNEGNDALLRLGKSDAAEVAIVRFDLRRWLEFQPPAAKSAFWGDLRKEKSAAAATPTTRVRETLKEKSGAERRSIVELHVRDLVASVLQLDQSKLNLATSFTDLGMDSLTSLELRNRLEASLELKLPATLLFTYATGTALVQHLLERCAPVEAPSPAITAAVLFSTAGEEPLGEEAVGEEADLSADDELLAEFDASMTSIKDEGLV